MKIAIVYGTTEGQTRKIAERVAAQFKGYGDVVTVVDAATSPDGIDLRDQDAVVVGASLHAGHYQSSITHFATAKHAWLNQLPAIFLSVSLSAAGDDPEDLRGIALCADQFKARTGWTNADVHHVAGAFRFTEYDFFKRWVMRYIAWQKSVKIDPTQDLELTDWDDLAATIDAFRASIVKRQVA